ncbi:MAG: hypothetical protein R3C60_05975 [Parvularculaceae bacterium]
MMKTAAVATIIALFAGAPAFANETADNCRAYVAENGGDDSGCACLGDAASDNSALADALAAIKTPDDLEATDDDTKAAIAACFPDSDASAS